MKLLPLLFTTVLILQSAYAPPVSPEKSNDDSEIKDDLEEYMEYHRYLKEVVQALESDPDFRERLEKAMDDDVRSGKIAEQLNFVNHNVRNRLDEIKRRELDRLKHLATKQFELTNGLDATGKVPNHEHLDHANPHTFEIEDLKKLIKKTTADLEEADKKRKEEFKEYEMQKEFDKHQKLEVMDELEKKSFEEKQKAAEEAKKHHQPIHHPGSKQQLEEVWEKQDQMDQQFDPSVFFMMHDVDGNGVWDANEVKALFIKELDKLYSPNGPNTDLHERAEEMERMREHVFQETDRNRDGLIDFNEFMRETNKAEFNQDAGWKAIDEKPVFTKDEYHTYEKRRLEELKYLQERGLVDAHGRPVPGAEHQIHRAMQELHAYERQRRQNDPHAYGHYQQPHPAQGQYYGQGQPQAVPQGGYQQVPQGGYQQVPQGGYQQAPQGGYQQPPQGGYQQGPQAGYQQPLQGGYQQAPQAGYQQPPQGGSQQPSQGGYQQPPQAGYQQPPQGGSQQLTQGGYQQPPQGGYQQAPQAGYQQAAQGGASYQGASQPGYQGSPQGGHQALPQAGYHGSPQDMPQNVQQGVAQQGVPLQGVPQQPQQGYSQSASQNIQNVPSTPPQAGGNAQQEPAAAAPSQNNQAQPSQGQQQPSKLPAKQPAAAQSPAAAVSSQAHPASAGTF